tara:strand:+ start:2324 stop:2737 length:414 start_codon:yes stop_codon:yes gene_type:complete
VRLILILCCIASSAVADSSALSLALPNPPMNYQSDRFRAGNLDCSNAVGGGTNLEFGVTGVVSNVGGTFSTLGSTQQSKDVGVYARLVIPLDKPKSRINCDDLYQVELAQRRLEIQQLRNELEALKDLQKGGMEFEN